jgi:lactoylglutathione lyase
MNIDHILVLTKDLKATKDFIMQTTGLTEGWRPEFPFEGYWLYGDGRPLIHLAGSQDTNNQDYLKPAAADNDTNVDHVALIGDDYDALIERLKKANMPYFERHVPLQKEHQVFVQGPGGLKIEFLFRGK